MHFDSATVHYSFREAGSAPAFPEYQIISTIARDRHTLLYKARCRRPVASTQDTVALKVIDCDPKYERQLTECLRQEARLLQASKHDHVVGFRNFHENDRCCYLAMEYAEGGSLRDYIDVNGPLQAAEGLAILHQALRGLEAIHQAGISHGDVRPETLFFTREQVVKIGGLRAPRMRTREGRSRWAGYPIDYLAPEILQGGACSVAGDLYAIGSILYELLAGMCPFVGTVGAQLEAKRLGTTPMPTTLSRDLVPAFHALFDRALAVDPKSRFRSALEFRRTIDSLLHFLV
ncbi:MAG: serine/threonine protein kinase [Bdellovibrionales bacterium]|nr:serine/threonine protein kinase [Bdellovibrionales bacterium]